MVEMINMQRCKWVKVGVCGLVVAFQFLGSPANAALWDCFRYNNGVEWCINDRVVVQQGQENAFTAPVSHSDNGDNEEKVLADCVARTLTFIEGDDPEGPPGDDSIVDEICRIGHEWSKICGDPPPSCEGTCVVPGCKCISRECR